MFWGKSSYKNLSPLRTRGDKVPALIYYGGQLRPGFLSAYTMGDKTFVCFHLGEQSLPGFKTEYKQEPFEILCRQKRIVWLNGCEYYGKPESMKWNNADYDRLYDKVAAGETVPCIVKWEGSSTVVPGFLRKYDYFIYFQTKDFSTPYAILGENGQAFLLRRCKANKLYWLDAGNTRPDPTPSSSLDPQLVVDFLSHCFKHYGKERDWWVGIENDSLIYRSTLELYNEFMGDRFADYLNEIDRLKSIILSMWNKLWYICNPGDTHTPKESMKKQECLEKFKQVKSL